MSGKKAHSTKKHCSGQIIVAVTILLYNSINNVLGVKPKKISKEIPIRLSILFSQHWLQCEPMLSEVETRLLERRANFSICKASMSSGLMWFRFFVSVLALDENTHLEGICCEYTDIFPFSSFIIYSLNYFPDIFSIYLFKAYYLEVMDIFLHFSH